MEPTKISSRHNDRIKHLLALQQKTALRRETMTTVVEGRRELTHCLEAGFTARSVFFCPDLQPQVETLPLNDDAELIEVTRDVYSHIAYRGSTEGVVAIVNVTPATLSSLQLPDNPLIVVIEGVEKPGNIGALLRTADAAAVDAVILCDPRADLYNPNLVRSSIGAVFTVPCVSCTSEECIAFLKARGTQILTAQLQDSSPYYDTPMTCGTAIVMGTEATGLSDQWRQAADRHILIPMGGRLDSLNVSVSAAILMFEAVRQRSGRDLKRLT